MYNGNGKATRPPDSGGGEGLNGIEPDKAPKRRFFTRDRAFLKQLFRLTLLIAAKDIIVCGVGLIDNVMIGAYSENALSGVALANQIQFLLHMCVGGVCEGMMVLYAQYAGEGRMDPVRRLIAIAVRVGVALSLVFFVVGRFFPEAALSLLTGDAAVIAEGATYMRAVAWSYPLFALSCVLSGAHRSVRNVQLGVVAALCAVVVNVFLNYALIYGNLGFPEWGARGAATATLASRAVECAVIVVYTLAFDKRLGMKLRRFRGFDRKLFQDFLRYGAPVFLSGLSWGIAMTVQTGILGHLGRAAIAANSVANTLFQVVSVGVYGMAAATAIVTGQAVGGGMSLEALRACVRTMQCLFLLIGLLSSLCLFAARDWIVSLYALTDEARALSLSFITVLCVTIVGSAYQMSCLTGIVRGGGNTSFVLYNDLVFMWGIVLPASLIAAHVLHLSPVIVFICLKADQVLKCFVAVFEVNSYRWVKKVTRADA